MELPKDIKYTEDHEWVKFEKGIATVGITDFAQGELGDIIYLDVSISKGEALKKGDIFGSIEAVKTVSDLFAPVSGDILEINESINDTPEMVNKDPYENGWLIKLKMSNVNEADTLLDSESYRKLIAP